MSEFAANLPDVVDLVCVENHNLLSKIASRWKVSQEDILNIYYIT